MVLTKRIFKVFIDDKLTVSQTLKQVDMYVLQPFSVYILKSFNFVTQNFFRNYCRR